MAQELEPCPPAADLYDYRPSDEAGVPLWLPHNQGDVFSGVNLRSITGEDKLGHVMLFVHPCTMRGAGGGLRDRLTVIEVAVVNSSKSLDKPSHWKNAKVIPLPDFSGAGNDAYQANMMNMGTVSASELTRSNRVLALSSTGRSYMLHRIIYHLTRHGVPSQVLDQATSRVQAEIQLQGDWTNTAWSHRGELTEIEVATVEGEFQALLDRPWPSSDDDALDRIRDRLASESAEDHEGAVEYLWELIQRGMPGEVLAA